MLLFLFKSVNEALKSEFILCIYQNLSKVYNKLLTI